MSEASTEGSVGWAMHFYLKSMITCQIEQHSDWGGVENERGRRSMGERRVRGGGMAEKEGRQSRSGGCVEEKDNRLDV
jgi:hypothetical protein